MRAWCFTKQFDNMKLFAPLYDRAMRWARHPKAPWYLGGMSFAESSFFPIPPDVMLIPMSLARPEAAWRLAWITTLASVVGGLFGYLIGHYAIGSVEPFLQARPSLWNGYQQALAWFADWGVWAVFIAGFSPIPYKVFTVAAGALNMALLPFVLASLVGRGGRFFLVAGLMKWGGAAMEHKIRQHIDRLGWATVALVGLAGAVYALR